VTLPSDARLRAAYAAHGADAPATPHPVPEVIAAAAQLEGDEAERLATLDHIASCARCRREFELLRATHVAARKLAPSTWRVRTMGLAAAAAVIIAVTLTIGRRGTPRVDEIAPDRGGGASAAQAITLITPLGTTRAATPRFVWHAVPTRGSYHIEVLDDSGAVVIGTDTRDTAFTAPALAPGRTYRWWVQAKVNGEAWQSEFGEIRTTRDAR
jgi:hypothetical protein